MMKPRLGIDFRIYDRDAIGQFRFRFVVIEHNYIHAAPLKIGNLGDRRRPTIHRYQKLRTMFTQTALQTFRAQAIAFLHPQRQE